MTDRTSSSITVAADRATVMGIIADFGAYPDWATGVRSAEVVEADPEGGPRRVRFTLDAGVIRDTYVLAYEWDGDVAVRWQLAEAGSMVTDMSGAYLLADDGGATKVSYELAVGTKVPLLGLIRRRAEKTIVDTALRGLKSRAESRRPAGGRLADRGPAPPTAGPNSQGNGDTHERAIAARRARGPAEAGAGAWPAAAVRAAPAQHRHAR